MIEDYEILRNEQPQAYKRSPWIELILSLVFIQALLFLLPAGSSAADAVPADAIQIRIVANSNTKEDQEIKSLIKQEIQPMLEKVMASVTTVKQLENELSNLSTDISNKAASITDQEIQVDFMEALIPAKTDGINFYAQDFHKALVITIGQGNGDNWWCALFPKVCYPEEEVEAVEEEPVKFWTWEWIKNKIF